jgi:DNA-binding NarL/FixJ family response regulator
MLNVESGDRNNDNCECSAKGAKGTMIRILIADDHDVVRQGMRRIVESRVDWQVCGEAANGREALALALKLKPDIAVLDLTMPELNGLETTREIRRQLPETEVLIFTMHESDNLIREVLSAGARGYVLKTGAGRQLSSAIEELAQHRPYFTPKVSETLLNAFLEYGHGKDETMLFNVLTDRERTVIQLLAEGYSNKKIGSQLGISAKTVECHRAAIMRKLNLHSIVDLVRYAIRNQIIEA